MGSSSSINSGLLTSARAIVSRRFIPPESESTLESRRSASCTNSSSSSVRCRSPRAGGRRSARTRAGSPRRRARGRGCPPAGRGARGSKARSSPIQSEHAQRAPLGGETAPIMRIVELAGTVRPQEAERLAPFDGEVDAVDGDEVAVALGEAVRLDRGVAPPRRDASSAPGGLPSRPCGAEVEIARREWEDGYRRLYAGDAPARPGVYAQVEAIMEELRRRVGSMYTTAELAGAYGDAERWAVRRWRRLARGQAGADARRRDRGCVPRLRARRGRLRAVTVMLSRRGRAGLVHAAAGGRGSRRRRGGRGGVRTRALTRQGARRRP